MLASDSSAAQTNNVEQQRRGRGSVASGVYKARITPHWFHDNTRFWYRNDLGEGVKEFIVVEAETGRRQQAFDHERLAAALGKVTGDKYESRHLPFSEIEFVDAANAIQFEANEKTWRCDLATYDCTLASPSAAPESNRTSEPPQSSLATS